MRRKQGRISLVLILALAAIALALWDGRLAEAMFPVGEVPEIDLSRLTLRGTPNEFLACPAGLCGAEPDLETQALTVPIERLEAAWRAVASRERRLSLVRADATKRQYDYVQRTQIMRFPDLMTVRLFQSPEGLVSVGIYSRSVYGRGDLGANRRRVLRLLEQLRAELARG